MKASELLEQTNLKFGKADFYNAKTDSYCALGVLMKSVGWKPKEWPDLSYKEVVEYMVKAEVEYHMTQEQGWNMAMYNNTKASNFKEVSEWLKARGL